MTTCEKIVPLDVGGTQVRLQQLKPGDQPLRIRRKNVRDDMLAVVLVRVKFSREHDLARVAETGNGLRFRFGLGQRGQQHRGKNRDDGDDHEQLDQSETAQSPVSNDGPAFVSIRCPHKCSDSLLEASTVLKR